MQGTDQIVDGYRRFVDSFGMVLVLLLIAIGFAALSSEGPTGKFVSQLLLGIATLFALRASGVRLVTMRVMYVAVLLAILVSAASLLYGTTSGLLFSRLVTITLVLVTMGSIVGRIAQHRRINIQTVLGALSFYLLIGLLFSYFYALVPVIWHVSPFNQTEAPASVDFIYFSYVTLATVGYGDFTPSTALVKSAAVLEALIGQLYLVSVVALLVSNFGRERPRREDRS